MKLHSPFIISSRLLPALQIGDGTLQLEYSRRPGRDGRTRYKWTLDIPAGEFSDDEQQSGCQGGSLQAGFGSLLSFLSAAAESYRYQVFHKKLDRAQIEADPDCNCNLFPWEVTEWAYANESEISTAQLEIEESETALIEE